MLASIAWIFETTPGCHVMGHNKNKKIVCSSVVLLTGAEAAAAAVIAKVCVCVLEYDECSHR